MPFLRDLLKKEAKFRLDIRKKILTEMNKKMLEGATRSSRKMSFLKKLQNKKNNYVCPRWLIQFFYPKATGQDKKYCFSRFIPDEGILFSKIFFT